MCRLSFIILLIFIIIGGCSKTKQADANSIKNPNKWAIFPTSTAVGKEKQFVVTGENLFACDFAVSGSVSLKKGDVSPDGSSIKLYITIDTLDAQEPFDKPGSRVIKIRTPDKMEELILKIIGEKVRSPAGNSP